MTAASAKFLRVRDWIALGVATAAAVVAMTLGTRLRVFEGPLVGQLLPSASFPVVAGGPAHARIDLAELRGHPVVLDFWATWCPPCREQAPVLARLHEKLGDRGLVIIGVDVDDAPEVAARFAEKERLGYAIVVDESGEAERSFKVDRLPTLIVADKTGKIVFEESGVVDAATLERTIEPLL